MKLYYFDRPGRAEAIRLLLTHAGLKFEDVRFSFEEWPKYKPSFELKQVPVLEISGRKLAQSFAVLEFLGSQYGYLPAEHSKLYRVVFVMNTVDDLLMKISRATSVRSPFDEKGKVEALEKLRTVEGLIFLDALERKLAENESQEYMVGHKYTVADFAVLGLYRGFEINQDWKVYSDTALDKHPKLRKYLETRMKDFNPYYKKCKKRLYYFEGAGRAEPIRMMLRYLGVPFEDIRIKQEDWPKMKESGKFELRQLPVLECEPCGLSISQTDAIMQRLGARYGLLPVTEPDKLYEVLWWCNTVKDLLEGCAQNYLPIPEAKKKELRTAFFEKSVPTFFNAMESRLKSSKSKDYLVGQKYTIADFYMIGAWRGLILNPTFGEFAGIVKDYPILKEYCEKHNGLF